MISFEYLIGGICDLMGCAVVEDVRKESMLYNSCKRKILELSHVGARESLEHVFGVLF